MVNLDGGITLSDAEVSEVVTKRAKVEVDLTPYKNGLLSILEHDPLTRKVTVTLTNERGHSASAVKQRFQAALEQLDGSVKNVDTKKVKLTYRNAFPGVMPITKMYLKWTVKDDDDKKKQVKK